MKLINATAVMAALGLAGAASAQTRTLDFDLSGISVRAGVTWSAEDDLKKYGSTFTGIGAEYTLAVPLMKGGETYLSADYITKRLFGERGSILGFTANQRWYLGSGNGLRNYYFLGAGFAFVDYSSSEVAFFGRGGVGTELSDRIFAEAIGTVTPKAGGASGTTVGVYLGYRF